MIAAAGMGLLDASWATAIGNFLSGEFSRQTAEVIAEFRLPMIAAGLLIGLLIGLTGIGGGTLMTPLLILLGIRPMVAVGTDLLFGAATKLAGSYEHWRRGSIGWRWVLLLAAGSVPASVAAAGLLHLVTQRFGSADQVVRLGLGAVLLVTAVLALTKELSGRRRSPRPKSEDGESRVHPAKIVLIGTGVGFMVGLTSLGSGSIVAVTLMALSRLPATGIVGTNIAHALVLLSGATLVHWQMGTVDVALAGNLLCGSLPGVLLGSRLAYYAPAKPLKVGMALLVLAGGLRMFRAW